MREDVELIFSYSLEEDDLLSHGGVGPSSCVWDGELVPCATTTTTTTAPPGPRRVPMRKAAEVLHSLRSYAGDNRNISYLYIVAGEAKTLLGVVDLRDLVVASETASLSELMIAPVVTAEQDCLREDLVALFAKYQFHMLPVVDAQDRLLGIVRNRDILKGTKFEPKAD